MRTTFIVSLIIAAATVPLMAGTLSDTYVIPAAAHTRGAGGELWQSDLELFNPNGTPLNVDGVFLDASGASRTLGPTASVAPNAALSMRDVVGSAGGQGAIILSGNQPFVVASRASATTARGTYGESITPAAEFIDETGSGGFMTGLASNSTTRTNIGVFAAADRDQPMVVTITILDGSGATAGTRSMTVPAGAMTVTQVPLSAITASTLDIASAHVRITSGSGIATAYASVVDNATSDSMFIAASSGVLPPGSAAAKLRLHMQ